MKTASCLLPRQTVSSRPLRCLPPPTHLYLICYLWFRSACRWSPCPSRLSALGQFCRRVEPAPLPSAAACTVPCQALSNSYRYRTNSKRSHRATRCLDELRILPCHSKGVAFNLRAFSFCVDIRLSSYLRFVCVWWAGFLSKGRNGKRKGQDWTHGRKRTGIFALLVCVEGPTTRLFYHLLLFSVLYLPPPATWDHPLHALPARLLPPGVCAVSVFSSSAFM